MATEYEKKLALRKARVIANAKADSDAQKRRLGKELPEERAERIKREHDARMAEIAALSDDEEEPLKEVEVPDEQPPEEADTAPESDPDFAGEIEDSHDFIESQPKEESPEAPEVPEETATPSLQGSSDESEWDYIYEDEPAADSEPDTEPEETIPIDPPPSAVGTSQPPPIPPQEFPDSSSAEGGDQLVKDLDLSDAVDSVDGFRDQAPDEIRSGEDIVNTAQEYHTRLADVLKQMQDILLGGIADMEAISARFQRMR